MPAWLVLGLLWLATRKPQVSGMGADRRTSTSPRGTDHRGSSPRGVRHTDWQATPGAAPAGGFGPVHQSQSHTPINADAQFDTQDPQQMVPGPGTMMPPGVMPPGMVTAPQTWQQAWNQWQQAAYGYGGGGGAVSPYGNDYGDPWGWTPDGTDVLDDQDPGDEDIVPGQGPGHWERAHAGEQADTASGMVWVADP